jgi:hypothetical protein
MALGALQKQAGTLPTEVIVPHPSSADVTGLSNRFPEVKFVPVDVNSPVASSERAEELRAAGVAAARGDIIALIEDHVRPDPDWSLATLKAHCGEYAAIGGAIENGVDRARNWAIYFTDLGRYQNPLPAGESPYASLVNVSYKRAALEQIATSWQSRFNETIVHAALKTAQFKIGLSPSIIVHQYWPESGLGGAAREFYTWGRNYGNARARLAAPGKLLVYACLSPLIPVVLLSRTGLSTLRKGRLRLEWFKALPVSVVLTLAWSGGELSGYLSNLRRREHTP